MLNVCNVKSYYFKLLAIISVVMLNVYNVKY